MCHPWVGITCPARCKSYIVKKIYNTLACFESLCSLKKSFFRLFHLLPSVLLANRLAVHPYRAESNKARHRRANARDPRPGARDDKAARPLIVRKVADADCVLLFDIGEERALVVDLEVEDAMLVGEGEGDAIHGSIGSGAGAGQVEAVEGRKHGKFELENVVLGKGEGNPFIPAPFRERDVVRLKKRKKENVSANMQICAVSCATYHIILDTVDARVQLIRVLQLVLNAVHAQHTNLLERPARYSFSKLLVIGPEAISTGLANHGLKPLVLQHLGRSQNRHASRVARLKDRQKRQLLAGSEQVIGIKNLGLLLGVVAVRSGRGANDGRKQRSRAKDMANSVGERHNAAFNLKIRLQAGANVDGPFDDEDVVGFGSGTNVVVEVVDDGAGALNREGNVELGEKADDGGGRGHSGRLRNEDVSVGVDKVDEMAGRQVWPQACVNESASHWDMCVEALDAVLQVNARLILNKTYP